jgi:glutamate:Na+ symporter, ESS family
MTLELDLPTTLAIAIFVLLAGRWLNRTVGILSRYTIPDPITGGLIAALIALGLHQGFAIDLNYDMGFREPAMLAFFSTIGLGASLATLLKGGRKLILFLVVVVLFLMVQNAVGLGLARLFDLNPLVGLIGGSITLSGGHGTGAAYAAPFAAVQNLQGAVALALTAATFGLVAGGIIGAPVARWLITRHQLAPSPVASTQGPSTRAASTNASRRKRPVGPDTILATLFAVLICLIGGATLARMLGGTGVTLPGFLFALLIGVVIRNGCELVRIVRIHQESVDLLGSVFLSLFLALTMMSLRLWELATLAGPLLVILAVQVVVMVAFASLVTYRVMGATYDAAILAAGHCGFGMGSTATAIANVQAVTRRFGPSPQSFVIVPLTGAFFVDLVNALVITGFTSLPVFGFGG